MNTIKKLLLVIMIAISSMSFTSCVADYAVGPPGYSTYRPYYGYRAYPRHYGYHPGGGYHRGNPGYGHGHGRGHGRHGR